MLEEYSIKKYGIPFLGLKFDLWSLGPVAKDIFVETSSDPVMLKDYISVKRNSKGHTYIKPARDFNDNEFSDMEVELLEKFTEYFGSKDLDELISYTHKPNGIWRNTAIRENVLESLESKSLITTDIQLDLSELIVDSKEKKIRYAEYIKFLQDNNHIPA